MDKYRGLKRIMSGKYREMQRIKADTGPVMTMFKGKWTYNATASGELKGRLRSNRSYTKWDELKWRKDNIPKKGKPTKEQLAVEAHRKRIAEEKAAAEPTVKPETIVKTKTRTPVKGSRDLVINKKKVSSKRAAEVSDVVEDVARETKVTKKAPPPRKPPVDELTKLRKDYADLARQRKRMPTGSVEYQQAGKEMDKIRIRVGEIKTRVAKKELIEKPRIKVDKQNQAGSRTEELQKKIEAKIEGYRSKAKQAVEKFNDHMWKGKNMKLCNPVLSVSLQNRKSPILLE